MADNDVLIRIRGDVNDINAKLTDLRGHIGKVTSESKNAFTGLSGVLNNMFSLPAMGIATLTAIASGLAMIAKHSIDSADQLYKMSQKVGMSVETLATLKYAADLADVELEKLQTGLVKLSKNAVEAANGSGEAKSAFDALGISVKNQNGTLKTSDQLLYEIADKFNGLSDGADKTAMAVKLFGKSGAELIPLLNAGSIEIKAMQDRAREMGLELSTGAAKDAEELNDKIRELKAEAEGFARTITMKLVPAMLDWVKTVHDAYKESGLLGALWADIKWGLGIGPERKKAGYELKEEIASLKKELSSAESDLKSAFLPQYQTHYESKVESLKKKLKELEAQYAAVSAEEKNNSDARNQEKTDADAELRSKLELAEGKSAEEAWAKTLRKIKADIKKTELDLDPLGQKLVDIATNAASMGDEVKKLPGGEQKAAKSFVSQWQEAVTNQAIADQGRKDSEAYYKGFQDYLKEAKKDSQEAEALQEGEIYDRLYALDLAEKEGLAHRETLETRIALYEKLKQSQEAMLAGISREADPTAWEAKNKALQKTNESILTVRDELRPTFVALRNYGNEATDVWKGVASTVSNAFKNMEDALVEFVRTGKFSFSNLVDSILTDLARIAVRQSITGPLASGLAGALSGSGGEGGLADLMGSSGMGSLEFSMSKNGNIFNNGRLVAFATGGLIVNRPTWFPMANGGVGLMGEAGPEAVMPLTRGADGKLGVKGAGGGNQVNVNIHIINNNGSQVSTESRETPQGMDIEVMIDQAVAGNISGHGKYANKALRQNFGARGRLIQR